MIVYAISPLRYAFHTTRLPLAFSFRALLHTASSAATSVASHDDAHQCVIEIRLNAGAVRNLFCHHFQLFRQRFDLALDFRCFIVPKISRPNGVNTLRSGIDVCRFCLFCASLTEQVNLGTRYCRYVVNMDKLIAISSSRYSSSHREAPSRRRFHVLLYSIKVAGMDWSPRPLFMAHGMRRCDAAMRRMGNIRQARCTRFCQFETPRCR